MTHILSTTPQKKIKTPTTKQLSDQELEAYAKIITAIDAVIKLTDMTAKNLPKESEVRSYLAYCAFDIKHNLLDSMYNKLMKWDGEND